MSRLILHYSGRVQGVGFRYSVCSIARGYAVTGYVKNLSDARRVEVCAEGVGEELVAFARAIASSHLSRYIVDVSSQWCQFNGSFTSFMVAF